MTKANGRTAAVSCGMLATAGLAMLLSACTTLGGPGPAICHAADGTMVPVHDSRCPEEVRRALQADTPVPVSIDQQMRNETYNAQHGLLPGDSGFR